MSTEPIEYLDQLIAEARSKADPALMNIIGDIQDYYRVEVERLQEALNRREAPASEEWLTKLHDRAHQQPQSRVWRTVDTLVHHLDRAAMQRQAVLSLCDEWVKASADSIRGHYRTEAIIQQHAEAAALVPVSSLRRALGVPVTPEDIPDDN